LTFQRFTIAIKRKLRFSIRTTLVLVALVALALAIPARTARIQKRVVDELTTLPSNTGGMVLYHHQFQTDRWNRNASIPGPDWLRWLVGDHYFISIRRIICRANEDLIADIGKLQSIESLDIDARMLVDEDVLRHLKSMRNLENLQIRYALKLEELNLQYLRDLPKLKSLRLEGIKIDDDALDDIINIKSLKHLTIKQTLITPEAADTVWDLRPDVDYYYSERVISPSLFP
jgi:Leucine-rich repeat (LRR) protein